jgi:hypothetical protein
LIIDYHEVEPSQEGGLSIHVGIQFEDEPDSLYVAHIRSDANGSVQEWKLFFNGFDCQYSFKKEEKAQLQERLSSDGIRIIYDEIGRQEIGEKDAY